MQGLQCVINNKLNEIQNTTVNAKNPEYKGL